MNLMQTKKKSRVAKLAIVMLGGLMLGGCGYLTQLTESIIGEIDATPPPKKFDMDRFELNIKGAFNGQTTGYSYAISKNGVLQRSDGILWGRTSSEPGGQRDMHENDRMHIASISKTITTAAVLRLLHDQGLGLDSSIEPFLPQADASANPTWVRGPGVIGLTFRKLLDHRSGIDFSKGTGGETDASLASRIANGVELPDTVLYHNFHTALFRIIVPYVLGEKPARNESLPNFHSRVFGQYVQRVVFSPAGIPSNRATTVPPPNPNRYYNWPWDGLPGDGEDDMDFTLRYGAYGWYMSSVDVARFLAYLRFTNLIIPSSMRSIMNNERLGWNNTRVSTYGTYHMKQGSWRWSFGPGNPAVWVRGTQSIAANFSGGIQAVVIMNSQAVPAYNMANRLRDAFDFAHIDP